MADPFQKVGQNDPLVFRADWFNFVTDAAKWVRSRQAGQGSAALLANDLLVPATLAYVKNTTGSSILAFSPVALSGDTPINPTDKPINARRQPVFTIAAPAGPDDLVFITMEPIADQKIGRAATLGVTVAQINVSDVSHQFAQPIAGNTTTLESAESGPIRILGPFVEGTGTRLVLLGGGSGSSSGDCTGCGWIVGLDETSCLTIEDLDDVTTGDIPNLTNNPSGSDDWLSTDVITIYGTDYYFLVYLPDAFHSPLRAALGTSDGSGGTTFFEDGFLDCCGSGYATFALNKKALIENRGDGGDPDEAVDSCENFVRFKVKCGCVTVPCFACNWPQVLIVRFSGGSVNCTCLDGLEFALVWDGISAWKYVGDTTFTGCSGGFGTWDHIIISLDCVGELINFAVILCALDDGVTCTGGAILGETGITPPDTCDPALLVGTIMNVDDDLCTTGSTINFIITES